MRQLVPRTIRTFAVDVTASGFSINTVGIILMAAGALGLVLSLPVKDRRTWAAAALKVLWPDT
jgi:hypothetical protein